MGESNTVNIKLPSLPLFTDTFQAETIHLENSRVGVYIRILCFNWTKHSKPFKKEDAYRICQCAYDKECRNDVEEVLKEFFLHDKETNTYTHKRLVKEYQYIQQMYQKKSQAGRKGMESRWFASDNKTITPIPIPNPIPNNIIDIHFENFWKALQIKRGPKFMARKRFEQKFRNNLDENISKQLADKFNRYSSKVKDKEFVCHVSTWLSQERYIDEDENAKQPIVETKLKDGRIYKRTGQNIGEYEEIVLDGHRWYKHKWNNDLPLKKEI